jgi:NADPH:quinone reductase-like Zn-dependent oxidoreductase
MQAIRLTARGREGVRLVEMARPEAGPGELRLRMLAASVNRVDLYMRDDGTGITHELPLTMGVDGVGKVLEGGAAAGLAPGQRVILYPAVVCGRCRGCRAGDQPLCDRVRFFGEHIDGTFATEKVVPAASVLPLPEALGVTQGAALGVAYLTAWRMVLGKAPAGPGQTVLVQGAGGGVSHAAVQIARMAGARVIATTTGAGKIAHLRALGVEVIDYAAEDVARAVRARTDGAGADLVIDTSGARSWPASLRSAAKGGHVVTCGATTGGDPSAEIQRLFVRQLSVHGSTLGSLEEFRRLLAAAATGALAPQIDGVFPLAEVPAAFDRLEHPDRLGKVIVRMADDAA